MISITLQDLGIAPDEAALLEKFSFDFKTFCHLREQLRAGHFGPERNRVSELITPPLPGDIMPWPSADTDVHRLYTSLGRAALERGEVAVAILNGGMATRFGGRVKGVVEVIDDLSFLGLKLRDIAAAPLPVPIFLMNSFATDKDTHIHLQAHRWFGLAPQSVHMLAQTISLRLNPQGELYRNAQNRVSCYAPGHGDLLGALAQSADFETFAARGGKLVLVSNVDNLGATLDPTVLGAHLHGGKDVTVEVAARNPGDAGGAPVRRGHNLEILEGFRFPENFPMDSLPVFNTNTFVLDVAAVHGNYPLSWFRADKQVDGAAVVQFERLLGEITSFVPATFLQVPRHGATSRFLPVKTPQDIEVVRDQVRQRFGL